MMPFYRFLTLAAAAFVVPSLYLRSRGEAMGHDRFRERLGKVWIRPGAGPRIWVQAVSVGEVRVAETFARRLRMTGASPEVVLSATTAAGLERAASLKDLASGVFAFPLDLPFAVRRTLDAVRPSAYGSIETEIWPGLLTDCGRRGIPVFIVNGSISGRSAKRYRVIGGAVGAGLRAVRAACMQSDADASRILSLGARPEAVVVTGNIKFDSSPQALEERAGALRRELALPEGKPLMIAGSTAPGEEAIAVRAWKRASEAVPGLALIVAPRHKERFDEAASEMSAAGASVIRRSGSRGSRAPGPGEAILLDTMGELEAAYALARAAFVGGSLAPRGGQNPLEPARAGVPVIFGPGMDNFRDVADRLVACGGAFEVSGADALADRVIALLLDPAGHERASRAARGFVAEHAGATEKTLLALSRLIPGVFGRAAS